MTEDEARTKECPQHLIMMAMVQISAGKEGVSEQGIIAMGELGRCSGSNCAIWVTTDNECKPQEEGDSAELKCFPAGHCGLIKEG